MTSGPLAPSDWKTRQYADISSARFWSFQCRVCGEADGTDSRRAARCRGGICSIGSPSQRSADGHGTCQAIGMTNRCPSCREPLDATGVCPGCGWPY